MGEKPIKVLFYTSYYDHFYGAQKILYYMLRDLDRSKVDPLLILPHKGQFYDRVKALGVPVSVVPLPEQLNQFGGRVLGLSFLRKCMLLPGLVKHNLHLRRVISSNNIELVAFHDCRGAVTSAWSAKINKTPVICEYQADPSFPKLDLLTYLLSNHIIACSKAVRMAVLDSLPKWARSRKKPFSVVHNATPLPDTLPDRDESILMRNEFGFTKDDVVIGMVASFHPRKRYDLFVKMAQAVAMEFPNARFLSVGDEEETYREYRQDIEHQSWDLMSEGRIVFAGWRDDMDRLYSMMDVVVLPSDLEGLPLSLVEAMHAGKPVVASNIAGNPELIDDRVSGFLFTKGNLEEFIHMTTLLIRDLSLRTDMGEKAKDKARAFRTEVMCDRKADIYCRYKK